MKPAHVVESLVESSLAAGSVAMPVVTVSDMAAVPTVDQMDGETVVADSGAKKKPRSPRKKKPTKRELLAAQASAVASDASVATTEVAVTESAAPSVDGDAVVMHMMVVDASSGDAQAVTVDRVRDAAHAIEVVDVVATATTVGAVAEVADVVASHDVWVPKMPALSIPWTRPAMAAPMMPLIPTLVIDDSDPESAERERDDDKAPRRSLIPSILLENDDRGRQGGLTLAVIILLIAATLTLSYLMRRPGAGGDGMTQQLSTPTTFVG